MNSTTKKHYKIQALRNEILKSLIVSFKIEGIDISLSVAKKTLKDIELSLEK